MEMWLSEGTWLRAHPWEVPQAPPFPPPPPPPLPPPVLSLQLGPPQTG